MIRTCDGRDPNLLVKGDRDGVETRPCDCGATFDDVTRRVIWPHQVIPPPLTPELVAEIMDAIAAGRYIRHSARCGDCEFLDTHRNPPAWHTWAGGQDIAHAAATGQPARARSGAAAPAPSR
jgi:hypothetical protein